jgi:hypothetical protein
VELNIDDIVKRFDAYCSRGLCAGITQGVGKKQQFCVEAAIDMATKGNDADPNQAEDDPPCVDSDLRSFKIDLNDQDWSSPRARARGLRDVGIAQLGTANRNFSFGRFISDLSERLTAQLIERIYAKDGAKGVAESISTLQEFENCSDSGDFLSILRREFDLKKDVALNMVASASAEVLIEMGTPGGKWLQKERKRNTKAGRALRAASPRKKGRK